MSDVTTDIHEDAIEAMSRDWAGPVGRIIREAGEAVADTARAAAPVSARGSKTSPPGALKARIHMEENYNDDGLVTAYIGAPRNPLNFIWNVKRATRNANRIDGVVRHYGFRPAVNSFFPDSLHIVTTLFPKTGRVL